METLIVKDLPPPWHHILKASGFYLDLQELRCSHILVSLGHAAYQVGMIICCSEQEHTPWGPMDLLGKTVLRGLVWHTSIPQGWWFVSQLLYFLCSNLLSGLGKAAENGWHVWAPATHVGDVGEDVGSWLWPSPGLPIVAICGMNQQRKDLSSHLTSFCNPTSK